MHQLKKCQSFRTVLSKLKEAGMIDAVDETGLFHFHENPNPKCLVGGNIHAALDDKIQMVQDAMEDELKKISMADVVSGLTREMKRRGQKLT